MVAIRKNHFSGGAKLTPDGGPRDDLAEILRDVADDLAAMKAQEGIANGNALVVDITALRTKFVAALAKLDADAGVTDTNYAALETPAAITATSIVSTSALVAQLNASLADLTAIRTKFIALLAKLDLDATVNGTDYTSLWTPAALTAVAITTLNGVPTIVNALVANLASLTTKFVGVLAKLDLDSGVTDTNYASLETPAAPTAGTLAVLLTTKG